MYNYKYYYFGAGPLSTQHYYFGKMLYTYFGLYTSRNIFIDKYKLFPDMIRISITTSIKGIGKNIYVNVHKSPDERTLVFAHGCIVSTFNKSIFDEFLKLLREW